jgi:hypothetical protein
VIGRLLGGAASLLVYVLAATCIAAVLIAGYVWSQWKLDNDKVGRAVAVLRGIEPAAEKPEQAAEKGKEEEKPQEQPTYEEILQRRALAARDLELKQQSLESEVDELKLQTRKIAQEREEETARESRFAMELKKLREGAKADGREVVLRTLASIKPAQAKQQLFDMLENNELDEVVLLLSSLAESKRAKIIAEFKTPDENKKLAEVLRRIRDGAPQNAIAEKAAETPAEKPASGT